MRRTLRWTLRVFLAVFALAILGVIAAIIIYPAFRSPTFVILSAKAAVAEQSGDFTEAERLYDRALDIISRSYPGSMQHAVSLNNLAEACQSAAHLQKAERLYLQSIAILDRILKPGDPLRAITLDNLAGVYSEEGRWTESDSYYDRALAIKRKALGEYDESTAMTLDNLGVRFHQAGDYGKAEQLYLEALAVRRRVLGNRAPLTATSLDHLGKLYEAEGAYAKAETYYLEALDIREAILPDDNPDLARTRENLGSLYAAEGAPGKAAPLFMQVLDAQRKKLGDSHPETATTLAHLGLLYEDEGRYKEAHSRLEETLAIFTKLYGPDHAETARARANLGDLYRAEGDREKSHGNEAAARTDYAEAEARLIAAQTSLEKTVPGRIEVALNLGNLARLYASEGAWDQAERLDAQAHSLLAMKVGEANPYTIAADTNEARDLWQLGRHSQARQLLLAANRSAAAFWSHNLTEVEGASRRALATRFDDLAAVSLTVAIDSMHDEPSAAATLAALAIAVRKGVRSSADQEVLARIRRDRNPETARLYAALRKVAEQQGEIQHGGAPPKNKKPADVDREAQDLEQQLIRKSRSYREFAALTEPAEVASSLAPGSAFIDVVFWSGAAPRYAAVIYRPPGAPVLVDLGPAGPLDEASRLLRRNFENMWSGAPPARLFAGQAFERNLSATLDDSAALYSLTVAKLKPALGDSKDLILSPDGALSTVPWEALRDGARHGHYLIEEGYRIRYMDSVRSLVHPPAPAEARTGAVVIANVDYSGGDQKATKPWSPLSGGNEILQRVGSIGAVQKLPFGSEEEVMALHGPAALIAHTHGFFLPGAVSGSDTNAGIILYGANRKPGAERDGWLTARETMLLDLDGTQLVALIGCETGLGAEAAEGVQGLRHALAVAGARSTILTLWEVGDRSSARFLGELLTRSAPSSSGRTVEDALTETRLAFLRGQIREPNSGARTNRWIHPYFWAAATLSGRNGPLNLNGAAH